MNKHRKANHWANHAIIIGMFVNYYYLVGTLCWAIIVPDQAAFIETFQHGGLKVNALYWGGIFGFYLTFDAYTSAIFSAGLGVKNGFRKTLRLITIRFVLDCCICLSFIYIPFRVEGNALLIRESVNPVFVMLATVLFLIIVTSGYIQIKRTHRLRRAMAEVACV